VDQTALSLDAEQQSRLFDAIDRVLGNQRQLLEESKHEAIRAMSEGFAEKMARISASSRRRT
jgi:hypothetical protein